LGKAHGEQKQWYPTGELYKKLNMNMGKEEGIQQAFRKNGDLYANYEAKEGRIFGLKKAALCYGLEDENIKYEK
jgi:antitoxin component YwqK of YwqJK toxin-antitoxin module